jgi:hypothetical protein
MLLFIIVLQVLSSCELVTGYGVAGNLIFLVQGFKKLNPAGKTDVIKATNL